MPDKEAFVVHEMTRLQEIREQVRDLRSRYGGASDDRHRGINRRLDELATRIHVLEDQLTELRHVDAGDLEMLCDHLSRAADRLGDAVDELVARWGA